MAVRVSAASVIIRNSTVEERFPGGMAAFPQIVPNQTFCTDGTISRVAFMVAEDASRFIDRLVAGGIVLSLERAYDEIAVVVEGVGFRTHCNWLQLGLLRVILLSGWQARTAAISASCSMNSNPK